MRLPCTFPSLNPQRIATMNGSLIDDLMGQMQGAALGQNAQQPGGADALFNALQRDHSGQGALDLGGLLGSLTQGGTGGGGGLGGLLGGLLGGVMGGGG